MAGGEVPHSLLTTLASFRDLGMNLRGEWLRQCIAHIKARAAPRVLQDDDLKLHVYTTVLNTDLRTCAESVLPPDVGQMADRRLSGPFIVQVMESTNIGEAKETRDKQTAKRCLRLLLTDGQQSVKAFEYRTLPDLRIEAPVGTKLVVRNATVRSGILLLDSTSARVLGGGVADSDLTEGGATVVTAAGAAPPPPPLPPQPPAVPAPPRPPALVAQAPAPAVGRSTVRELDLFDDDGIDWAAIPDPTLPPPPTADHTSQSAAAAAAAGASSAPPAASRRVSPARPLRNEQRQEAEVIVIDDDTPPSTAGSSSSSSSSRASVVDTTFGHTDRSATSPWSTASSEEVPFVSLGSLSRHEGKVVRVKACAVAVEKASLSKKGLRILIVLDDGGHTVTARLGDAVLQQLMGTTATEFRSLRDADPAAAQLRLSQGQRQLSTFEGVMEIKVQGAGAVPVVVSRRAPSLQDLREMVASCSSGGAVGGGKG